MDRLTQNLRAVVGRDGLLTEPDELLVYECDGLPQHKFPPRAVVFPRSTEEVAEVVRVLAREGVPFAPRGAGTGLSGGALALARGVVIELARMRRLLKLDAENRLAVVETGLVNAQLSRAAAPTGLHYVPDPSSQMTCTIGGNIAENAGGIHCLKYGMTVDHVLGARVVLGDGETLELGGADIYNGGYDLLGVFVGSEGTFGIATEATVRLTPLAPAVRTVLADFADVDDASRAVSAIIAGGIIPAALEMVDGATIRAVEASVFAAGLPTDAEAALLVELDGLEAGLDEETARVESICLTHRARHCRRAVNEHERKKLWLARKGAFGAMGRISPDLMLQDAVVPRSRLPEVLAATYRIGTKYNLRVANVFHAGDGNLHPFICFDSRNADEVERVKEAGREIMETCVRAGGTITGEHGVGMDKSDYMPLIFSETDLDAMRRLRTAFDPLGLCNPGKIIPTPRGCGESRAAAVKTEGRRQRADGDKQKAERRRQEVEVRRDDESDSGRTVGVAAVSSAAAGNVEVLRRGSFDVERAWSALGRVAGAEHLSVERVNTVDGEKEALTVAPSSVEEACEVLRLASSEGWTVVPAGAGLWLDAGNALRSVHVIIKTGRMSRLIEHEPADLVATVEAGMTLRDFNAEAGRAGQWLPLDPPDDGRATLGGVVATGLGGAQSFGYGMPRNFLLGARVALADGRTVRAGGRVVKNVAGYDLCKLFTGSYGTLALLLELTFKLRPRPAREATLVARASNGDELLKAARALVGAQLLPVAVELLSPLMARVAGASDAHNEFALFVRFAGNEQAVAHQIERTRAMLGELPSFNGIEAVEDDARLWSGLAAAPVKQNAGLRWRAQVPPTSLGSLLAETFDAASAGREMWQANAGSGRLRVFETEETNTVDAVSRLTRLREFARGRGGGTLVVEHAAPEVKRSLDAWGNAGAQSKLMRRIKEQFDPQDILSRGRF